MASTTPSTRAEPAGCGVLMAAALLLPGLATTPALGQAPAQEEGFGLQVARYREAGRQWPGVPVGPRPLSAENLQLRATAALPGGDGLSVNLVQDSWSGASPVTTAPHAAQGNRPYAAAGGLPVAGASPMITGRLWVDAAGQALAADDATGALRRAPALVHTLSSASAETRQQLDARYSRRLADGTLSLGGGLSQERDHAARFASLGRRFDREDGLGSLSLGLAWTRSRLSPALDHDAAPYIGKAAYQDRLVTVQGRLVLPGRRQEWTASLALGRVLAPDALAEFTLAHTRSTGDLSNPYKLVSVAFAPPGADPAAPVLGDLRALMEQRPARRRQWQAGARLVLHEAHTDGALHLGLGHGWDDWGLRRWRAEASWFQPLPGGWMAAPRVRYDTQSAARFYAPWLVSRQAYRQVSIGPDGQPLVQGYDPGLLPRHFSSDHRLAGFGSLSAGLALTRRLGEGQRLVLGLDHTRQAGRLKAGGGGEGAYADFRHTVLSAGLQFDWGPGSGPGGQAEATTSDHADHAGPGRGAETTPGHATPPPPGHVPPPPGLLSAQGMARGAWMLALRETWQDRPGPLRQGGRPADAADLARACGGQACRLAPARMRTRMPMAEGMVGLGGGLSLMGMVSWMAMDMRMQPIAGAAPSDQPLHFGRHETSGLGDSQLHLLVDGAAGPGRWLIGAGLGLPTGRSDRSQGRSHQTEGLPQAYDMQTGSGHWEWRPSVAWEQAGGRWAWGLQASGAWAIGRGRNEGDHAWGPRWSASAWGRWQARPWLAWTLRWSQRQEARVRLARMAEQGASPGDFAAHHGGHFSEAGLGVMLLAPPGAWQGSQLALEAGLPLRERANGLQLAPGKTWTLSLGRHF